MIVTKNLTKKYGNFTAVDQLNLSIEAGESYGFLGPNGAGKTTTLSMLLGILKPTSGEVFIKGESIRSDSFALKQKIGVVAEYQTFYERMTAWEYVLFFAQLFGVQKPEQRADELFHQLHLEQWKNLLISGYSTGMKKKLGFIRALIHSPELLVLDEPVSGLDPFGIIQVRGLLMAEKKRGCTLIISSHILSEVEQTADKVGILSNGKLILENSMDTMRSRVSGGDRINLSFATLDEPVYHQMAQLPFVQEISRDGNHVSLLTHADRDYREDIGKFILHHQLVLLEMRKSETSLEEVFMTITESSLQILQEGYGQGDAHAK
jgi:ABC-2 type transport system ATP-binding protein